MFGGDINTSKAAVVYRWLREEFEAGRVASGDRLPSENELCERFGASRPSVRQATARLAHEGLVHTDGAAEGAAANRTLVLLRDIQEAGTAVLLLDNTLADTMFSSIVIDDYGAGGARGPGLSARSGQGRGCWSAPADRSS